MIEEIVDNYLSAVGNMLSSGDAREESYYTLLEDFILKIRDILKRPDLQVVIMPKTTDAGNPDLVIKDSQYRVVGYIEAKDPRKKLDALEDSPQVKRYREVFPNLVLTNFLEFRLYRKGELKEAAVIGELDSLVKMGIKPIPGNEKKCWQLFREISREI